MSERKRVHAVHDQAGFTMPELLVVTGFLLIAVIAAVILLRPKPFDAQNATAERQTAAAETVQALARYHADTGTWPQGLSTTAKRIGTEKEAINLCNDLVPTYIDDMPTDPLGGVKLTADLSGYADTACAPGVSYETGFSIAVSQDGQHVTLTAPAIPGYPELRINR